MHKSSQHPPNSYVETRLLSQILEEEQINSNLKLSFRIPNNTFLRSRKRRKNLSGKGRKSPPHTAKIEPKLVVPMKCMNNIKRSITMSEGIAIANNLIISMYIQ